MPEIGARAVQPESSGLTGHDGRQRAPLPRRGRGHVGRRAPASLYDPRLASFDAAGGYQQADAAGFIRLSGLRLRLRGLVAARRGAAGAPPKA